MTETYIDQNHGALIGVAKRCEEQGRHYEAEQWRDCALRYANGECMDSAETIDAVDVITNILIAMDIVAILLTVAL